MDVLMWFSMCLIVYQLSFAESLFGKLLISNEESVLEFDIESRNVTALVEHEIYGVYSLDYDNQNRYVYFPRFHAYDIVRFTYPSKNITLQHFVTTSYYPAGVAVDSANGYVYWVNNDVGNKLSRCKLDGTSKVVLFTGLTNTFTVRLDVTNRWVYIAYFSKGISKSRFDLTDFRMIANFTSTTIAMDIDNVQNCCFG